MVAKNNRTIILTEEDRKRLSSELNKSKEIVNSDLFDIKCEHVDLLFLDMPYNMNKKFGDLSFTQKSIDKYTDYLKKIFTYLDGFLKDAATIYICGDWLTSISIFPAASSFWHCQNRITWERDKGRGSKHNWKASHEDIWFFTKGNDYKFYPDRVKLRRKVIAPYKVQGRAKDWNEDTGFRDTYPSNMWTDLTVPFWSMSENTVHPTQKPEALLAKLILASTDEGDVVFDPFCGSGTALVVAKKLNRRFFGCDINHEYCLLTLRRLEMADCNNTISGYKDGVFWKRNNKV